MRIVSKKYQRSDKMQLRRELRTSVIKKRTDKINKLLHERVTLAPTFLDREHKHSK